MYLLQLPMPILAPVQTMNLVIVVLGVQVDGLVIVKIRIIVLVMRVSTFR